MILPVLTLQNVLDFHKFENALFKPSLQKNCAANAKICKWMMIKLNISFSEMVGSVFKEEF